ncbi:MAG TPA: DNRLRE domain-containing protein, partial [Pirellulales bacterium]
MRLKNSLIVLAAMVTSTPLSLVAGTITIEPSKDNTIFQNNVDNSSGGANGLYAGTNGSSSPRRGLIAFDVAGNVPGGATITGVQLTLYQAQVAGSGGGGSGGGGPVTIELHKLLADWGEGTVQSGGLPDNLNMEGQ